MTTMQDPRFTGMMTFVPGLKAGTGAASAQGPNGTTATPAQNQADSRSALDDALREGKPTEELFADVLAAHKETDTSAPITEEEAISNFTDTLQTHLDHAPTALASHPELRDTVMGGLSAALSQTEDAASSSSGGLSMINSIAGLLLALMLEQIKFQNDMSGMNNKASQFLATTCMAMTKSYLDMAKLSGQDAQASLQKQAWSAFAGAIASGVALGAQALTLGATMIKQSGLKTQLDSATKLQEKIEAATPTLQARTLKEIPAHAKADPRIKELVAGKDLTLKPGDEEHINHLAVNEKSTIIQKIKDFKKAVNNEIRSLHETTSQVSNLFQAAGTVGSHIGDGFNKLQQGAIESRKSQEDASAQVFNQVGQNTAETRNKEIQMADSEHNTASSEVARMADAVIAASRV